MNRIFEEENRIYQIDFGAANWATDQLNHHYKKIASILNDVDFIAETDSELLLVEYKNSDVENASNPGAFVEKLKDDKHYSTIAMKFYGGLIYLRSSGKYKPCKYIYILECSAAGSTERLRIRAKIRSKLPFELQNAPDITQPMIDSFEILSIADWNNHSLYGQFPISRITAPPVDH